MRVRTVLGRVWIPAVVVLVLLIAGFSVQRPDVLRVRRQSGDAADLCRRSQAV